MRSLERGTNMSMANFIRALPECLLPRFSISSITILLSCTIIIVSPRTLMELIGPYRALCSSQCSNSGLPGAGRSLILPKTGSPFGPGGRGVRAVLLSKNILFKRYSDRIPRPTLTEEKGVILAIRATCTVFYTNDDLRTPILYATKMPHADRDVYLNPALCSAVLHLLCCLGFNAENKL